MKEIICLLVRHGKTAGNTERRYIGCRTDEDLCTEGIEHCRTLYLTGALTDTFLNHIRGKRLFKETEVVVTDFTKIFLTPLLYKGFVSGGGKISVMMKSKLIAVTVNPTAPNGMVLDSEKLCKTLSEAINLPVYDLMKN